MGRPPRAPYHSANVDFFSVGWVERSCARPNNIARPARDVGSPPGQARGRPNLRPLAFRVLSDIWSALILRSARGTAYGSELRALRARLEACPRGGDAEVGR